MRSVNKTKYRKYRQNAHLAIVKSDAIVQEVSEKARAAKKSVLKAIQSVSGVVKPLDRKAARYTKAAASLKENRIKAENPGESAREYTRKKFLESIYGNQWTPTKVISVESLNVPRGLIAG